MEKNKSSKKVIVKMYSTPTCPWCIKTREFLKKNKIKFIDFDVSRDSKAAKEMLKKSKMMATPVIDIDGKIIVGFDEEQLKKILKIK
ncbi:MAG: glutaredoxin domain-containing protein [Candidatus Nanoarchaeia archaeon]